MAYKWAVAVSGASALGKEMLQPITIKACIGQWVGYPSDTPSDCFDTREEARVAAKAANKANGYWRYEARKYWHRNGATV